MINDHLQRGDLAAPGGVNPGAHPWTDVIQLDSASPLSRVDFRRISSHISQKRPGYYLILLRTEIRHRSLREKPALTE